MSGDEKNGSFIHLLARKAGQIMSILVSILLAIILLLMGALLIASPGKPAPFLDATGNPLAGSISEKVFVDINGVRQGMFIKGKNVHNPVLLALHGGMPDYFLAQKFPTGLEDAFTVVWWEQRGTGMSYSPDIPRESLNQEQMISDTLAVTNYLRERFGVEKIYLMGHSGGTFIGIQAAARAPELYYAYIGVAQMADQLKSEKIAYDYMLAEYKKNGNTSMAARLEAAPVTAEGVPDAYQMVRDIAMHDLGVGTMHDMKDVVSGVILPSLICPDYTFVEKVNMWTAKAKSGIAALFKTIITTDLKETTPELKIPVYFFEGVYDYTCVSSVAGEYFDVLRAPVKGYYTFKHSAHCPIFEEPERVMEIIRQDVLAGKTTLADRR
jgi:pimeloyl-ACP methyl ester carboxylesterase